MLLSALCVRYFLIADNIFDLDAHYVCYVCYVVVVVAVVGVIIIINRRHTGPAILTVVFAIKKEEEEEI